MTTVAINTLSLGHGFMLVFETCHRCLDIIMAFQAHLAGLLFQEQLLVGAVRSVTDSTVALGEWRVNICFRLLFNQALVAGQAELASLQWGFEQAIPLAAMRGMATGTFPFGEWLVLAEQALFRQGLVVT